MEGNEDPIRTFETNAIWDTGATGCCITPKVVQMLGLKPYSKASVLTAGGQKYQNAYKVCFHLHNNVSMNIAVTEVATLRGDVEALIGMNVISLGDFTISNFADRTCMTFRMPSLETTDYTGTVDRGGMQFSEF